MAQDEGKEPPCATCAKPREFSRKNAQAWEAWCALDRYGRAVDAFAGVPLPLSLEALERFCARYDDPEGIRWRVMALEEKALAARREQGQAGQQKRKV